MKHSAEYYRYPPYSGILFNSIQFNCDFTEQIVELDNCEFVW